MENQPERTRIMVAVAQSIQKGYPNASDSSREAFDWILENIIRSNVARFNLQFLHVQHPDASNREHAGAIEMLEDFRDRCHQIGVAAVASIIQELDTKTAICSEVKRLNSDLLVMGSGRKVRSFQRFLINQNKRRLGVYCSRHAQCPVIIVKGGEGVGN